VPQYRQVIAVGQSEELLTITELRYAGRAMKKHPTREVGAPLATDFAADHADERRHTRARGDQDAHSSIVDANGIGNREDTGRDGPYVDPVAWPEPPQQVSERVLRFRLGDTPDAELDRAYSSALAIHHPGSVAFKTDSGNASVRRCVDTGPIGPCSIS
jgi:hypothetical protein